MIRQIPGFNLLFMVTLTFLFSVSGEAQEFTKGRISDTVKCMKQPSQKYCLYLPSSYNMIGKWPIILIFDPGGQGITAVKAFRQASDKYSYILACSYNSKNGPLSENFAAAGAMLDDLSSRFSIDSKRIYTAGFSGGSRFALALASTNEFIAGVIGCGAGLPNESRMYPSGRSKFLYYGTAGNRDMNYLEMFDLMEYFNSKTPVIAYLRTFDGGHQWPVPDILQDAVEWFTLQTMKKNDIQADTAFISSFFKRTLARIDNLVASGNRYDAERYMRYAIRDFSGLKKVNEITGTVSKLDQSKEFRAAKSEWSNIASMERNRNEKYISSVRTIVYSGSVPDSLKRWWKNEAVSLNGMKEKSKPAESQMASRLLNYISILFSEQGTAFYREKFYELSGFFFEICTISDSENKNNYFNFARSLAGQNRKREAIDALNRAVDHGLSDMRSIENEAAFGNLRNEEKYKSLLNRLK